MVTYIQNIEELQKYEKRKISESRKYRGRIPKKKRIRNKIQKQREIEKMRKFYMDEFHLISANKK